MHFFLLLSFLSLSLFLSFPKTKIRDNHRSVISIPLNHRHPRLPASAIIVTADTRRRRVTRRRVTNRWSVTKPFARRSSHRRPLSFRPSRRSRRRHVRRALARVPETLNSNSDLWLKPEMAMVAAVAMAEMVGWVRGRPDFNGDFSHLPLHLPRFSNDFYLIRQWVFINDVIGKLASNLGVCRRLWPSVCFALIICLVLFSIIAQF